MRPVKNLRYKTNVGDLELLKRDRGARPLNLLESALYATNDATVGSNNRARKSVLAAIGALLVAQKSQDAAHCFGGCCDREVDPIDRRPPGAKGQGPRHGGAVTATCRRVDTREASRGA